MVLAACSTGGSGQTSDTGAGDDTTITVAHEQEFSAYNNNTSGNNAVKNTFVLNQVLPSFWEYGPDGEVVPLDDFGSYEKTKDDPLTVEYKINKDAVWSDGDPIDCDDVMLMWAAYSGKYPDAKFDPASTTGYELMKKPTCKDGDKDFTIEYEKPFSDWIAGIGGNVSMMPAHIAEKKSGVADIVAAVEKDNVADLTKVAEFWNTGWTFNPGQLDKEIIPSSGPYVIDSWQAGQSVTLKRNDKYWGKKAATGTIVVRFIEQEGQAQALQNGDIQIAEPQPNPDVLNQLKAIGDKVTIEQGDQFTFEHFDFNFTGPFADPNLRKAFALCLPRQEIVDKLIKPVNANATLMESRFVFPFQPSYDGVASAITDGAYDKVDIAASKALLDAAGKAGMQVRIGHIIPNQRRTDEVALIKASCDQAGFNVVDHGTETFFDDGGGLDSGDFDVALFAWSGSPLVSGNSSIYITGGGQNKGKYSNPKIDALMPQLDQQPDKDKQVELIKEIEKILWDDLATIPVFTFPAVVAHDSNVENVVQQPSQSQVSWNMQKWALKS